LPSRRWVQLNRKKNPNSLFITFEGGDGAGKSTLIEELNKELQNKGHPVLKTRAPGGTAAGQLIRAILLNGGEMPLAARCELFLYLADRAQHVETVIQPALQGGQIVLCDRYNDSTIAYQGVGRGFGVGTVENLCAFATNDLKPDLTIYLDVDPRIGMNRLQHQRNGKDRIEAEDIHFHEKIRAAFLEIAHHEPSRVHVIDASKSREEVLAQARSLIDVRLAR